MTNSKYTVTKNDSIDEQNPPVSNSQGTTNRGKEDQKRRKSRIFRLCTMLVAIVVFCIVELVIGHLAHSLALVADSFHMMSDALSLIIAAVAIRMGGKINKVSILKSHHTLSNSKILGEKSESEHFFIQ